jgi:7-keto-8-aminopelargonate synthetase-like enzyme
VKNDHPVFCAPNEFPLMPQHTKTLRVSIVLLHTTSDIRVSFHALFSPGGFKALGIFFSFF